MQLSYTMQGIQAKAKTPRFGAGARGRLQPALVAEAAPRAARFVLERPEGSVLARSPDEPSTLFVRLAVRRGPRAWSVEPALAARLSTALDGASRDERGIERATLVGTDALFVPGAERAEGYAEVLALFVDVLRCLTARRVPFVWRMRGGIPTGATLPPQLATALRAAGNLALVEVGVPALDPALSAALEGGAGAPPDDRLRLLAVLHARGVPVRALIDPLVPMLSDQQAALDDLLQRLAAAGVTSVTARYLVLTHERAKTLSHRLTRMQRALIQGVFAEEPWQGSGEGSRSARGPFKLLPATLRRRGQHRLVEAGLRSGVHVEILDPANDVDDSGANAAALSGAKAPVSESALDDVPAPRPQLDLFGTMQ